MFTIALALISLQVIDIFLFIFNLFSLLAGVCAQGIWLHSQITKVFTVSDAIKEFPWLLRNSLPEESTCITCRHISKFSTLDNVILAFLLLHNLLNRP